MSLDSIHAVLPTTPCRVALIGFGTVGSAVARRLLAADPGAGLRLTHIFDRHAEQQRLAANLENPENPENPENLENLENLENPQNPVFWTSTIDDILQSDADIIVEAIGGLDPAGEWIRSALEAGKSVVTANKQLIARHGPDLWALAARQGRQLRFEAAVGGAMPIVRALSDGLAGDRIIRIVAILNGTTNAVLSRMETSGCTLADAVLDAQARGYAEADPSLDLDGCDAQSKLAILCALAFGLRVDPSQITARSAARLTPADVARARRQGGALRQVAHAEFDYGTSTLTAWVAPVVVAHESIFARTTGAQNVALVTGVHAGEIGISGAGAGGDAAAVAVLSDLRSIARDRAAIVPAPRLRSDFRLQDSDFRLPTSDFELAEAV